MILPTRTKRLSAIIEGSEATGESDELGKVGLNLVSSIICRNYWLDEGCRPRSWQSRRFSFRSPHPHCHARNRRGVFGTKERRHSTLCGQDSSKTEAQFTYLRRTQEIASEGANGIEDHRWERCMQVRASTMVQLWRCPNDVSYHGRHWGYVVWLWRYSH